ncbi:hypothetical protein QQF64_012037 [Cirrhinus molitorella]|uniref:Reverse transcriptase/retrotransposon-derived protein RNase H-like domain-containing protein n=1 Tax=Cirrhinus molitorella TaxID=172907 RepID=A0ABR3LUA3_9TELE
MELRQIRPRLKLSRLGQGPETSKSSNLFLDLRDTTGVQDFSKITRPLNDLTIGYPPLQKNQRRDPKKNVQYRDPKEHFGDQWTKQCQQAFNTLIEKLTSAPVLGFANPNLPYVLTTDASTTGLGAALYQEQEGQMRVIAFASRGLTKSETKYPAHKLEFLALKRAVTGKFSDICMEESSP